MPGAASVGGYDLPAGAKLGQKHHRAVEVLARRIQPMYGGGLLVHASSAEVDVAVKHHAGSDRTAAPRQYVTGPSEAPLECGWPSLRVVVNAATQPLRTFHAGR